MGVPSRFANSQLQIPANLAEGSQSYFNTPFNRISRFRESGRMNLNTMTSADELFGLMNIYFSPVEVNSQMNPVFWDKFARSRRGDGTGNAVSSANAPNTAQQTLTNMFQINAKMPSRFMQPYRTPGGASLTPPGFEPAREADVTLLRPDPDSANRPLFEIDDYLMGSNSSATGSVTPDQFKYASMDFNRNSYFRYQALQKMGGAFSTHSNVFAIWITVGFFEVLPATNPNLKDAAGNLVYPDGFQLGQELGSDSGNITRHRAFYIFDRSIPVGFVRGQDINQDKATLLKRFIE